MNRDVKEIRAMNRLAKCDEMLILLYKDMVTIYFKHHLSDISDINELHNILGYTSLDLLFTGMRDSLIYIMAQGRIQRCGRAIRRRAYFTI